MVLRRSVGMLSIPLLLLGACGTDEAPPLPGGATEAPGETAAAAQDVFWNHLRSLCGNAYSGSIVNPAPTDSGFVGKDLVMHVRDCEEDEIRIPFHVGDDRSRTWIITRTPQGPRLKHDHRHEDGSEDEITQYGGDTRDEGTEQRQEFYADEHTASLIPAASTNIWTVEVIPGQTFGYGLRREGTDRRFRVNFDLTRTVPAPPAAWGHE